MLSLSNCQIANIVKAFCDEIEKARYYAMFYCNLSWLSNYLFKDELIQNMTFGLLSGVPSAQCEIWQKLYKETINGIIGNANLDIAYKDYL